MDAEPPTYIAKEPVVEQRSADEEYKKLVDQFIKAKPTKAKDEHIINVGRLFSIRLPGEWSSEGEQPKTFSYYLITRLTTKNGAMFEHVHSGEEKAEIVKLLKEPPHTLSQKELDATGLSLAKRSEGRIEKLNGETVLRIDSTSEKGDLEIRLFVAAIEGGAEELCFSCSKTLALSMKPQFEVAIKSIHWSKF